MVRHIISISMNMILVYHLNKQKSIFVIYSHDVTFVFIFCNSNDSIAFVYDVFSYELQGDYCIFLFMLSNENIYQMKFQKCVHYL